MRESSAYESLEQEVISQSIDLGLFRFLMQQLRPYKWLLGAIFFMLFLASGSLLTIGVGVRWLIDKGLFAKDHTHLAWSIGLFLVSILLMAIASFGRLVLVNRLTEQVTCRLRETLFERLLFAPAIFLEHYKSGELLSRLTTDLTLIHTLVSTSLPIAMRNFFILCGGIVMLFVMAPQLALHILLLVPCIVLPIIFFGRHVKQFSRKTQTALGQLHAIAEEGITALRVIQAFGREIYFFKLFQEKNQRVLDAVYQMSLRRGLMVFCIILIVFGAVAFMLWYGGQRMLSGELSGGSLTAFIFYAMIVAGTVNTFSEIFSDLFKSAGAVTRLQEILTLKVPLINKGKMATATLPTQASVSFQHVNFAYPARPHHPILEGLNFVINKGETVAIVGPSGAGKTTIFQLLLGFYTAQQGHIVLDQQDSARLDYQQLRAFFSYVPQDATIFSGSIYENLQFGDIAASEEEIMHAARQADVDAFVRALPDGYNTQVGERGIKLSGGQKQRIAIARALLKGAPILLLDEATSSLDTASEKRVQKALETIYQQQTTLIIAHRLSTIQKADRIIVIDKGRVVEEGTHKDLMLNKGLYYSLVQVQFSDA